MAPSATATGSVMTHAATTSTERRQRNSPLASPIPRIPPVDTCVWIQGAPAATRR